MRIPLDYYRILGLPIQATSEQLQQAYGDRAVQLPRREYSDVAIAARKQLLDEAYTVLSDPEKRANYDTSFLEPSENTVSNHPPASEEASDPLKTAKPTPPDLETYNPTLEIPSEQLVGALLILHELGEYELVLKLGRPYINNGSQTISLDKGRLGDPHLVRPDIVLTLSLACLEMGREQWLQGQYENAALSLDTGQKLLFSEDLFPSVRGEIQSDIYKLRPYRILELLALPEESIQERSQGMHLLQDMLQERGGIDGIGDDQSGLSVDDFLRFIQQLRTYLTSEEQQALFSAEAKRPSAVATYLAVYALMARGFAYRRPALVAEAKELLMRLGKRQDVHLEQAVCALLLGQTEEATRALELSQEYEPLAYIREHSQGSPDLLPGLCLYGERWLEKEVFPHFRDLVSFRVALKDYFADEQVQADLEALPSETETPEDLNQGASVEEQPISIAVTAQAPAAQTVSYASEPQQSVNSHESAAYNEPVATPTARTATVIITPADGDNSSSSGVSTLPPHQPPVTPSTPDPDSNLLRNRTAPQRRRQARQQDSSGLPNRLSRTATAPQDSLSSPNVQQRLLPSRTKRHRTKSKHSLKTGRLLFVSLIGFLSLLLLGMLVRAAYNRLSNPSQPSSAQQPKLQSTPLAIPTSTPDPETASSESSLTEETAQQVVETWLSTKAEVLGPDHQIDRLNQILVAPALSRFSKIAQTAQKNNTYSQFKHKVEIQSVKTSETNPDRGSVEARVSEAADVYQGGKLNKSASYNNNLRVRYDLSRTDDGWRIRDINVLK